MGPDHCRRILERRRAPAEPRLSWPCFFLGVAANNLTLSNEEKLT